MHTGKLPLASRVSRHVREEMFALFMATMCPTRGTSILDLGVTSDHRYQESNYFEQLYPYKDKIVCAGIEDASFLEQKYPGVTFVPIEANRPLSFSDKQFDVVFSNAVVEHVGGLKNQQFFIEESLRVARAFFITTPNRWFPVEMHTGLPFLHYLPMRFYRVILAQIGLQYWASEDNLNLLDGNSFLRLFSPSVSVSIAKVRFLGIPSNLIAYGESEHRE
jgi:hypothetical protein